MHDPKVVAFDVKIPIPRRGRPFGRDRDEWSSGVRRRRFTNPEHLGQSIYPWWRPCGYHVRVAGKQLRWRPVLTVWHNEPGGADALKVCRKSRVPWQIHVHHWSIQIPLLQRVRRFVFERCGHCKRRYPWGYAPVSHGWSSDTTYHFECSDALRRKSQIEGMNEVFPRVLRRLLAHLNWSEQDLIAELHQRPDAANPRSPMVRMDQHVIPKLLGWEFVNDHRVDGYWLEKAEIATAFQPHEHSRTGH